MRYNMIEQTEVECAVVAGWARGRRAVDGIDRTIYTLPRFGRKAMGLIRFKKRFILWYDMPLGPG